MKSRQPVRESSLLKLSPGDITSLQKKANMSLKEKRELDELIRGLDNDRVNCATLAELHKGTEFGAVYLGKFNMMGQVINKLRTFQHHCQ